VIAQRGAVVLRTADEEDLPAVEAPFAQVDTGLDEAHIPAGRAYEAVGFDRRVPNVDLWQRL
jgi:hypothetical protein